MQLVQPRDNSQYSNQRKDELDYMEQRTILIVEDEQRINDILVITFKKEGYKVLSALDGISGLEMALNDNPDIILLDVMLPGMDGFDVLRKIREKSQVPVLMLTAREDEVDKVLGLRAWCGRLYY